MDWYEFIWLASSNEQVLDLSLEAIYETLHENDRLLKVLGEEMRAQLVVVRANQEFRFNLQSEFMRSGTVLEFEIHRKIDMLLNAREPYVSAIIQANWWPFDPDTGVLAQWWPFPF